MRHATVVFGFVNARSPATERRFLLLILARMIPRSVRRRTVAQLREAPPGAPHGTNAGGCRWQ
eukprot:9222520-Prorocentrum_lima.AAC.1